MTNEEILKRAVEKALKNGWKPEGETIPTTEYYLKKHVGLKYYYSTIFSHSFAEVFAKHIIKSETKDGLNLTIELFGTEVIGRRGEDLTIIPEVLEEVKNELLQQMVIEKEPLKYLERFLDSE